MSQKRRLTFEKNGYARGKIMNANNFLFVAESLLNAIVFLLVFAPVVILWLEEELLVNKKRKKDKKKHHKKTSE